MRILSLLSDNESYVTLPRLEDVYAGIALGGYESIFCEHMLQLAERGHYIEIVAKSAVAHDICHHISVGNNIQNGDYDCVIIGHHFVRDCKHMKDIEQWSRDIPTIYYNVEWQNEFPGKRLHDAGVKMVVPSLFTQSEWKNVNVPSVCIRECFYLDRLQYDRGISRENNTALFAGALVAEKGFPDVIRAAVVLRDKTGTKLRACGTAKFWGRNDNANCGKDCIEYLGPLSKLKLCEQYQQNQIFLFPSYHKEGCPVTLIEAQAFGCVPICYPGSCIEEFVINGFNGIVVKERKFELLVEAVEKLELPSGGSQQYKDMQYNAMRRIKRDFNRNDNGVQWENFVMATARR